MIIAAPTKKLTKKEQKAKEDAEFEALMSGISTSDVKAEETKAEAPKVGDANAKNQKKKNKKKAKAAQV